MDTFSAIRIKTETAKNFRAFSKKISPTHSQALETMISFFVKNGISPHENCGPNFLRLEKNILKRINTIIGFLKIKEKNYSKPTLGILMALMDKSSIEKKVKFQEKLILAKPIVISHSLKAEQLKTENERLKRQIIENQKILRTLMSNDNK